ncbi:MAG: hypothetical protein ACRERC_27480 [Candidatus Binatia bacterium]
MSPRRIAGTLLLAALLFAAITLYALEGLEVVVVHTRGRDGSAKQTRTWIADADGFSWIEAATPERPFFQQLLENPEVEVERDGTRRRYLATPVENPRGNAHIRGLLAERYGWADAWVGMLTDTSGSVEVRLQPQ